MSAKHFLKIFISAIVILCLGLLCAEIVFRLLKLDCPIGPHLRYSPIFGYTQIPLKQYTFTYEGEKIAIQFNKDGFRDIAHTKEKPKDTKRIVVIGDSFCEAAQVNLEDTFFRKLDKKLNASGAQKWEVINLGVADYGTTQEWLMLIEKGFSYSPDIVIHQIFPLNDICNNSIGLYGCCKSRNDHLRPYAKVSGNNIQITYAQPVRTFLRNHVITYRLFERWLYSSYYNRPLTYENQKWKKVISPFMASESMHPLLNTFSKEKDQIPGIRDGWNVTEKVIERCYQECRKRGIAYGIVVVPFEGFMKTSPQKVQNLYAQYTLVHDYPEARLRAYAVNMGIPVVILKDEFEKVSNGGLLYCDGHLSVKGHQIAADTIFQLLTDKKLR